jgi:colanic acid/amylovoran biosynthesis protein
VLTTIFDSVDIHVLSLNARIDQRRCNVKVSPAIGSISLRELPMTLRLLIRSVSYAICRKLFHLKPSSLLNHKALQYYANADAVLVRGGDTLTNYYGSITLLTHFSAISFALLLKKPVLLLGHTLGPFGYLTFLARLILNKTDLIIVRDNSSKEILKKIGVNKPHIYVTADLAFLLKPPDATVIRRLLDGEGISGKYASIAVSQIYPQYLTEPNDPNGKREKYVKMMVHVIDYVTNNLGLDAVIISHVFGPKKVDDRIIAKEIYSRVSNRNKVFFIQNEYRPEELKGIISYSEFLVGSRMHACIAALSTYVPTVALAYGGKFHNIIGDMMGQRNFILSASNINEQILMSKVNELWDSREAIKHSLQGKVRIANIAANQNIRILRDYFQTMGLNRERS